VRRLGINLEMLRCTATGMTLALRSYIAAIAALRSGRRVTLTQYNLAGRYGEKESTSFSQFTFCPDPATMPFDDLGREI
jgi:hypothetical protein